MQCGGAKMMSKGGKVSPVKKMQKGGSSGCPLGQCPKQDHNGETICVKCPGVVAGLVTTIGGSSAIIGKMIGDSIKKGKEVTAIKRANPGMKRKKAREIYFKQQDEKLAAAGKKPEQKGIGGAKYKSGGIAKQKIVGMPGYNARTDTMKMGGFKDLS